MMDSMTNEELDGTKKLNETRMIRIAKGSGTRPEEVNFLLEEYKKFAKMVEKMGQMKLSNKADLQNVTNNIKFNIIFKIVEQKSTVNDELDE